MEHSKCPACGSGKQLYGDIARDMVIQGLAPDGFRFAYEQRSNVIATKEMMAGQKLGDKLPTVTVVTDICTDCGCMYAIYVEVGTAVKRIVKEPPKLVVPGGMPPLPPGGNNPKFS